MKGKRTYYMHTINGHPGVFRGGQICYASLWGAKLVLSLNQIREEQRASERHRLKRGYKALHKYDYCVVKLP